MSCLRPSLKARKGVDLVKQWGSTELPAHAPSVGSICNYHLPFAPMTGYSQFSDYVAFPPWTRYSLGTNIKGSNELLEPPDPRRTSLSTHPRATDYGTRLTSTLTRAGRLLHTAAKCRYGPISSKSGQGGPLTTRAGLGWSYHRGMGVWPWLLPINKTSPWRPLIRLEIAQRQQTQRACKDARAGWQQTPPWC